MAKIRSGFWPGKQSAAPAHHRLVVPHRRRYRWISLSSGRQSPGDPVGPADRRRPTIAMVEAGRESWKPGNLPLAVKSNKTARWQDGRRVRDPRHRLRHRHLVRHFGPCGGCLQAQQRRIAGTGLIVLTRNEEKHCRRRGNNASDRASPLVRVPHQATALFTGQLPKGTRAVQGRYTRRHCEEGLRSSYQPLTIPSPMGLIAL